MSDDPQYEVKVLRTLEEVEQLRAAWSSMQWNPESDIDFVSFIINVRPEIIRPHVIVVYENGKPLALLAGRLEHGYLDIKIGYKVIYRIKVRRIGIFYGGLMGQITPEITKIVVRQLLRSLRKEKADLLMWSGVRCHTKLHAILNRAPNLLCRDYLPWTIQHWTMSMPLSMEELLEKKMNKKHRHWAKRMMRILEKDFPGAVRFKRFFAPNEMDELFEDAVKVARKTYQWGLGVGFKDDEEQRNRLRLEATLGWLRGYILYLNDEPAAFWISTVYGQTAYLAFTGYDPKYRKYEVGTALFLWMMGDLCGKNLKQMDFGLGSTFYKERFGDTEFEEAILSVFAFSFRGICLNTLRLLTGVPVYFGRILLKRLGLEQKVKTLWRTYLTRGQSDNKLVEPQRQQNS